MADFNDSFWASDADNIVTKIKKKWLFSQNLYFSEILNILKSISSTVMAIFCSFWFFFFVYVMRYFWANLHLTNQNVASEQCSGKNRLPKVYIWLPLCSNSTQSGPKSSSSAKNRLTRARFWLTEDQNRLQEAQNRPPKAQNGLSDSKNLTSKGQKATPKGQKSTPTGPNTNQKPQKQKINFKRPDFDS